MRAYYSSLKVSGYNPFPKLTEAFASEPELLKQSFETLWNASRALAVSGPTEARLILERGFP